MATTSDAQPGLAPATDALLQEILLELQTLNRKLEVRDAEPVSSDVVLNKAILETSLLAMAEGMSPEVGTLDSEDGKMEPEIDMKLEGPELASGAEIPSNSEAEGEASNNVVQGSEVGVEVAHMDSAELLAPAAEDSPETGVKEEVENVERPYSDREVATGGERVGWE
jgi:hypothetical protein